MKVIIESTKTVKPLYEGNSPPQTPHSIPLTVFDKAMYNTHSGVIYAYRPPTPPNATIEHGLRRALSEYREWAGSLGQNDKGDPIILLNDKGAKFVEASVDGKLDDVMPLEPSPVLLSLHPSLDDPEELLQVQLTRFTCGSLVVGFTAHHLVGDGHSASNFLVAWGKACRGVDMSPLPLHDRNIFKPRNPPKFEFEHRGVEYKTNDLKNDHTVDVDEIIIHKFHFTLDFLTKLKAKASSASTPNGYNNNNNNNKTFSTVQSLAAHLWRTITKARGLTGSEKINIRVSVNGRMKMNPTVPNEYLGNLVLWTYPKATVNDLLSKPLSYAAKTIHENLANFNHNYFQSFIDFATHKVKEEGLVPTAELNTSSVYPNVDIDSWMQFPFNDLDFGGGSPYLFMPAYFPIEGVIFIMPSLSGDRSIDAVIPLFKDHMATFKQIVYSLD